MGQVLAFTPYPAGVKKGALAPVTAFSIYRNHMAVLPARMAWQAPDAAEAFALLEGDVNGAGGLMYLSDCFRSRIDQARAHADYLAGCRPDDLADFVRRYRDLAGYVPRPKKAFSPPPGGSFHEAGRAFDLDMDPRWLGMDQKRFADLAYGRGWTDAVGGNFGDPERVDVPEEWHWQFLGPFQAVYDRVENTSGRTAAAREAARAAIADIMEA